MAAKKSSSKSRHSFVSHLVETRGKQVWTTSLAVAEGCKLDHRTVIQTIRKHHIHFDEFGPCTFEMRVVDRKQGGGTPIEYAILNEDQATFAITLFRNNETVIKFKIALVKAFRKAINELERIRQQQQEPIWQQQRLTGKTARLELTDGIKEFVEYAKAQGSQNAERYYQNITKMEYRALFMVEKAVGKEFRDTLTALQNANLTAAENIAQKALRDGMKDGMHYKAIFPIAKARVEQFATLIQLQPALTRDYPQLALAA
jgi:phage regulator Rha-like protein